MKELLKEYYIDSQNLAILQSVIGRELTGFQCADNEFEFLQQRFSYYWPTQLIFHLYHNDKKYVHLKISNELLFDEWGGETNNFHIESESGTNKYINGSTSIHFNEVLEIEIYANERRIHIGLDPYDQESNKILEKYDTNELIYTRRSDELILFNGTNNRKLLIEGSYGLNGELVIHFDQNYINNLCLNKLTNHGQKTNYSKRLALKK